MGKIFFGDLNKGIVGILLALVLTICYTDCYAQTVYSPYSNFGLGNIVNSNNSVIKSLGNSSIAYRDYTTINFENPASYTAFDTMSFVFDASVNISSTSLYTVNTQSSSTYFGLGNLQIGFPIAKKLKASAGLIPMTNVGYDIVTYSIDDTTGKKKFNLKGSGGINNVYFGLGMEIGPVSIGANVSYLFGSILKSQALLWPDSTSYFNVKILDQTLVNSLYVNTGLQYNTKLAKDFFLCVGATYTPQIALKSNLSVASYTYTLSSDIETVRDTVLRKETSGNDIVMPQKIGVGVMLRKLNSYKLLMDFEWRDWSSFEAYHTAAGALNDSYNVSLGFEYSPRTTTVSSYFKWVKYRLGAYYQRTPLVINDRNINQYGATIGLGFPIVRSASTINVTLEVANRGTKSDNLIQETYINATIGFSLYDTWFYRIKYK